MTKKTDQAQAAAAEPVVEAAPVAAPELTIQDLGNLRAIIDVAAQRGAFRAPELEAVGGAFNKLNAFLNAVAPEQPADAAPAA